MIVNQIIKTGIDVYNKAGYCIAKTEMFPASDEAVKMGAKLIKKTITKHKNGSEKFVEVWLGENDKAIRTIHFDSERPHTKCVTTYEWAQPKAYDRIASQHAKCGMDDQWTGANPDSPYVFENIRGRIVRQYYQKTDVATYTEQKISYTNLDINKDEKTVTKSIGTVDLNLNTTSEIYGIQNGKKVKGIYVKAEKQPTGISKIVESKHFGIPDRDVKKVLSDRYFHARFLSPKLLVLASVGDVAKKQRLSYVPRLVYNTIDSSAGYTTYSDFIIAISKKILNQKTDRFQVIEVLEHEMRHLKQHELIRKMLRKKLKNKNVIKRAEIYKREIDNYIDYKKNEMKYREQLVELEAFEAGYRTSDFYNRVTKRLKKIFPCSTNHSVGV